MGMEPGEVFVHGNLANMLIGTDLNAMAVVEYAIEHLKVSHVLVFGHYSCGVVKAAMKSADLGILNPWLIGIAAVQKENRKRGLKVYGWVFDIRTGKLIDLKIDFEGILHIIMVI